MRKRRGFGRRLRALLHRDRRASTLVEFAVVGPVFILFLFVAFEVSYDLYLQEVLDTALQATARQIQTGTAQPTSEQKLVNDVLCPNALGLLRCGSLFVRVEKIDDTSASACPGGQNTADLYDATDGRLPVVNGVLELSLFGGGGGDAGPETCNPDNTQNDPDTGFCVAGPSGTTPQLFILSAVYVAPSFLNGLVTNTVTYNGTLVRATFSTAAFVTEGFAPTTPSGTPTC